MEINLETLLFIGQSPNRLEGPNAWVGHIPFAFYITKLVNPNIIVELGTHTGNSFLSFVQAVENLSLNTKCYAIDTWKGDEQAGYYDDSIYLELQKFIDENFSDSSKLIRKTFDDAHSDFEDKSIDILHIDGLHTYDAVKHDYETWKDKLSDKGVILFHDTAVFYPGFGVCNLWQEIKEDFPHIEFKHSNGLGVLVCGKDVNENVIQFINDFNNDSRYINLFEMFGENISNLYKIRFQNYLIKNLEVELDTKNHFISKIERSYSFRIVKKCKKGINYFRRKIANFK
jgi:hypothetical protein